MAQDEIKTQTFTCDSFGNCREECSLTFNRRKGGTSLPGLCPKGFDETSYPTNWQEQKPRKDPMLYISAMEDFLKKNYYMTEAGIIQPQHVLLIVLNAVAAGRKAYDGE